MCQRQYVTFKANGIGIKCEMSMPTIKHEYIDNRCVKFEPVI